MSKRNVKIERIGFSIAILLVFIIVSSLVLVFGQEEQNLSVKEQASICLEESKEIFQDLEKKNFSTQRVNDSLNEAENLFNAQFVLESQENKSDFSLVLPYCEDIKKIRENAFKTRDEFSALKKFYDESLTQDMNASSVDKIMLEIEKEIRNERYEKVGPLIDNAYKEIGNIKASHTALKLFYKSTTRSLERFFQENWIYISSFIVILVILFIVYRKAIRKWQIKRKISKLEIRKATLRDLIMQAQRDYFQYGKISEGLYNIRTKKFAELIRDIDREIPLLKEELVRVEKEKTNGKK